METKVYGMDAIDGYIRETLVKETPVAMMWPILEQHHSPYHINASVYGVNAGPMLHPLVGLAQFSKGGRNRRKNQFYLGFNAYDTEFLRKLKKTVIVIDELVLSDIEYTNQNHNDLVSVTNDLSTSSNHKFVVIKEYDDRMEIQEPQEVLIKNKSQWVKKSLCKPYISLNSMLFKSSRSFNYEIVDVVFKPEITGVGLVSQSYLDLVRNSQKLPWPNIIISRDLAMDLDYHLQDDLEMSKFTPKQERQKAADERLRSKFEQYKQYTNGKPIVLVFDLHGYRESIWKEFVDFNITILRENFDDITKIDSNSLEYLLDGYLGTKYDGPIGPIYLARSKS